jgi:flavorubredoxin
MLLEFLLSHEDVTALTNAIKKINVGDTVDWVSQSWDQVATSTIKNSFRNVGLNEDAIELEQDDRPTQDQEEMFHLAKAT